MSDMPYNLVGVSLQTKYTTKTDLGPSFAFYETIMSYLPVTASLKNTIFLLIFFSYIQ